MKNIRMNKYFYIFTIFVLFISAHIAMANETFQNNLLKMDFSKSSISGIKITLYTSKPYKDTVTINKKSHSEYVILMPETSNSMTANPILNPVASVVRAVNVKTQQYENQIKGYTKITIATNRPIEITPNVQTINSSVYNLSEKDYSELLAQTSKKKSVPAKNITAPKAKTTTYKKVVEKPAIKTQIIAGKEKIKTPVLTQKATQKVATKPVQKAVPVKKFIQQPTTVTSPKVAQKPKTETQTKPILVAEKVKEPVIQPDEGETAIKTEPVKQMEQVSTLESPAVERISAPVSQGDKFQKYKDIIKNNLYYVMGLLFAGFLLLLLAARKMAGSHSKQKEIFKTNLEETPPQFTDYTENISEDMTWKEKFQTYVDTAQTQASEIEKPVTEQVADNKELDDLFSDNYPQGSEETGSNEEPSMEETLIEEEPQEDMSIYSIPQEEYADTLQIDELFGEEDLQETVQEPYFTTQFESVVEDEEIIKSEFAIDNKKGFYLVDYQNTTALVGHIEDEIFVLKRFNNKIDGTLQARLSEKTARSSSYMTRVGKFKALVEVTPDKMNLLIEL